MITKQYKTTELTIERGCIIANKDSIGIVRSKGSSCVLIEVDLVSKYAETAGFVAAWPNNLCGVFLTKNKETLYADKNRDDDTLILFKDFPGYRIFSASIFRYTLCAALVKGD